MSSVIVAWNGRCREPQSRYRLLGFLHRLASLSDAYLRTQEPERPHLSEAQNGQSVQARPNVEGLDRAIEGSIVISSDIIEDAPTFPNRAHAAGLPVVKHPNTPGLHLTTLSKAHLRGLDFRLYDPRQLYPGADRMSFVFLECPDQPLLDGRLVRAETEQARQTNGAEMIRNADSYLDCPQIQLHSYLEDWTDCLFSWMKFFFIGDLWWQRREELQGYSDYRGVFSQIQTERGKQAAEEATFEALLATFAQHAHHWSKDVNVRARGERG